MCTAVSYQGNNHYFGRNLDLDQSFIEAVTITPRNYSFQFRCKEKNSKHYAMIGMAAVIDNYPLYYDATNEKGLSMAGLNFPGNAKYLPYKENKDNIAPFELIPWILCQCANIAESRKLLERINLLDQSFNINLPNSPLHWILSDRTESIVIESCEKGIVIFANPIGVLTNNPPFDYHMHNLTNYINLTADEPTNRFSDKLNMKAYSRGMGGIGLPGDLSSSSRFIRAAFTKLNASKGRDIIQDISQFFHILDSVAQTEGCVKVGNGYEKTIYSSCCNTDKGIYYYKTYNNNQITGIHMFRENLDSEMLLSYPLRKSEQIYYEN